MASAAGLLPSDAALARRGAAGSEGRYRKDIDGLRALAVAPIVLAHAGVAGFEGGFVGVDLFFVVSGYLITSILAGELAEERFSLLGFYRRRAVRILPALLVMLAAVLLAGRLLMFPAEAKELGKSAGAAAGFIANLYFLDRVDYFMPFGELRPLLHSWSLGAEEQFYLLYPLLLIAAWRLARGRLLPVLLAVTAASMAFSGIAARMWPEGAFYLLPSRAWELGLGALVALGALPTLSARARSSLAVAGAVMVVAGLLLVRSGPSFPFPAALLPCAGCALLLAYGEGAPTARLLSAPPVRALGLVSYSLYLWHWPVIAFYRLETGLQLDATEVAGLLLVSLALAILSFLLVEQPFRRRFRSAAPLKVLTASAAGILVVGAAATVTVLFPASWRGFTPEQERIAGYWQYYEGEEFQYQFRKGPCFHGPRDGFAFDPDACLALDPRRANVAVVGESHAAQYWRAIALRYPRLNVMQATPTGCRPLVGARGTPSCAAAMDRVFGPLLDSGELDALVVAARWTEADLPRLTETIAHVRRRGVEIVVIGPTVEYHGVFPALLARAMARADSELVRVHLNRERWALDRRMASAVRAAGGRYVSVLDILCPGGRCRLTDGRATPMQFDYGHLTLAGARYAVDRMELFGPAAPSGSAEYGDEVGAGERSAGVDGGEMDR